MILSKALTSICASKLPIAKHLCSSLRGLSMSAGVGAGVGLGLVPAAKLIGAVNLAGFCITAVTCSHKITDLCGTSGFVATAAYILSRADANIQAKVLSIGVLVWGVRLGGYLFWRILQTGKDERLDMFFPKEGEGWLDTKGSTFPVGLAGFWTIQAAWAWVCMLPILLVSSVPSTTGMLVYQMIPVGGMFAGIVYEAVADFQKSYYKANDPSRWVSEGLYSFSRYPNYFGELLTWYSVYACCFPLLPSLKLKAIALASPLFITALLLYGTGIPPVEKSHLRKYGSNPEFMKWYNSTPALIPNFKPMFKDAGSKDKDL